MFRYSGKGRLQSTPPHKGATNSGCTSQPTPERFNPRPLTRGRLLFSFPLRHRNNASIRAPSPGGDILIFAFFSNIPCFNPRPLTRGRQHPVAGKDRLACFNPRPLTRGRLNRMTRRTIITGASIHAPSQGGDAYEVSISELEVTLQSTPPHKGATPSTDNQRHRQMLQSTPPHKGAT